MSQVLIKPVITEKTTALGEKLNSYTFAVDRDANKIQIKSEVEKLYGVSVESVNTSVVPRKLKSRFTKKGVNKGFKGGYKKAIVTVADGDEIDFYSNI
ncbi:MAG: 50S ribosomal protein L23 [Chitinophagales bacterium]